MDKKYTKNSKFKAFMKRNMYYFIIGFCVLAIGAMITVALVAKDDSATDLNQQPNTETPVTETPPIDDTPVITAPPIDDTPVIEPVVEPIVFSAPIADGTVNKDYTMSTLVYWSTLKHYAVHNGIDYSGATGTAVNAAYGGKVLSVSYDALNGNVVKIDHGGDLVTYYGSLDTVNVTEGQTVAAGDAIGTIGTTATNEMLDGAHVHFAVYEKGVVADPYSYLPSENK